MKTFKLCYNLMKKSNEIINYTYKDGYYHTRLSLTESHSEIVGFEAKLSFVTSLAFAYYLCTNTVRTQDLANWDNMLREFVKSETFTEIVQVLDEIPFIHKGLKVLKPYSKKKVIGCLSVLNSYKPLLEGRTNRTFYHTFSDIFGCDISDFLIYDDTEVMIVDEVEINNTKFKNKHKNVGTLWE